MRRALSLANLAGVAALALSGVAQAQSAAAPGQAAGLRYLTWNGRAAASADAASVQPVASRPDLRRPNRVIPHGGFASAGAGAASTPAPRMPSPTPNRAEAALAARPAPAATSAIPTPAPIPAPGVADAPPPRVAALQPDYVRGNGQPIPTAVLAPTTAAPAPAPTPVYADTPSQPSPETSDPMAPRRDAPIFRLQRPGSTPEVAPGPPTAETPEARQPEAAPRPRAIAQVANTGQRPPAQGARYYSVHRQNGRQPDALSMPDPTYIDALAVTLTETPASQDLAQPDQGPTLIRDRNGKTRALPAASNGDHQ